MATSFAPISISGGSQIRIHEHWTTTSKAFGKKPSLVVQRKSNRVGSNRKFSVSAEYQDGGRSGGTDFVAGFLLGGAIFGTLAYIYAPQVVDLFDYYNGSMGFSKIRRSLLNEDEYGFRKAKRPIYYDDGLEKTRQTLNAKLNQLNSAIDKVSSRLRGGNNSPTVPVETDPEVEATM